MNRNYKSSMGNYFFQCFLFAIPAIILGLAINKLCTVIKDKFQFPVLAMVLIQLLIAILVLYIIEIYISAWYGASWQSTTPGLFFAGIYFGLQTLLFADIVLGVKRPGLLIRTGNVM